MIHSLFLPSLVLLTLISMCKMALFYGIFQGNVRQAKSKKGGTVPKNKMVCAGNCRDKVKNFVAPGNEFLSPHLFCAHLYCFIFSKKSFSEVANTARRFNKRYSCFVCLAFSRQLYKDFRFFLTLLINNVTSETVKEPRTKTTRARAFSLPNVSLNFLEFYSLANWTWVSMWSAKGRQILPPSLKPACSLSVRMALLSVSVVKSQNRTCK